VTLETADYNIWRQDGDDHEDHDHEDPPHYAESNLSFMIDPVLKSDDVNNDGMIDYAEYIAAQIKLRTDGLREGVEVQV
jgi:hypothetical protein